MCISGDKSKFSYNEAAWPPHYSGGWSRTTLGLSMTSAPAGNRAAPWSIKSVPSSKGETARAADYKVDPFLARLNALCPPRPPMPRIKRERMRPSAGERFLRALATLIAGWGEEAANLPLIHRMELLAEVDWSSATFVGVRARIMVSYTPVEAGMAAHLSARLTAAEYRLGAHLLADLQTDARRGGMMVEALLLEVH
jgi:hypothetical protein